jgi:hypothetical protein
MIRQFMDRIWKNATFRNAIVLILGLSVYQVFFVVILKTGTICFFQSVFGIPCPGCGLTRSLLALCTLDFHAAVGYHPLSPVVVLAALLLVFRKYGAFRTLYESDKTWQLLGVLFCLVWALRMFFLFPTHEPFVFNESSVAYRLFEIVSRLYS